MTGSGQGNGQNVKETEGIRGLLSDFEGRCVLDLILGLYCTYLKNNYCFTNVYFDYNHSIYPCVFCLLHRLPELDFQAMIKFKILSGLPRFNVRHLVAQNEIKHYSHNK